MPLSEYNARVTPAKQSRDMIGLVDVLGCGVGSDFLQTAEDRRSLEKTLEPDNNAHKGYGPTD